MKNNDYYNRNIGEVFGWQFKNSNKTEVAAPYIAPQNDDGAFVLGGGYYGLNIQQLNLDQTFNNDQDLIRRYRAVSIQPEPDQAITEIVNEAVNGDDSKIPIEIVLDNVTLPDKVIDKINEEHDTIVRLLNFKHNHYEIFRKWYVDARLYYYIIIDEDNPSAGIQELRYMSPLFVKKIREEIKSHIPGTSKLATTSYQDFYLYQENSRYGVDGVSSAIKLPSDSVCYVNSGLVDEETGIVRGWLHKAIKPANNLRFIEDACVIYRISRAPERRIFYVDVGNMPTQRIGEYMKNIMAHSKNKMVYDTMTGEVKDQTNVLSMMEDLWLPRQAGSKGTEVDTLKGGENLGKIDDIEYFKKQLYQSLNVPYSRIADEEGTGFNMGKSAQISREELKFSKFIARLRKKFSFMFLSLLRTQLLLKNIITEDEWDTLQSQIFYKYNTDNYYEELKETEMFLERVNSLKVCQDMIGTFFPKRYLQKKLLQLTDAEIEEMEREMEKERKEGVYDHLNQENFDDSGFNFDDDI